MLPSNRVLALLLLAASPAMAFEVGQVEVYYLDATDAGNGFTLPAEPGDYEIYPAYDADHDPGAWDPWATGPADCDDDGANCRLGFVTQYTIGHPGGTLVANPLDHEDGVSRRVYETADLALADAATETLCLDAPGDITLAIEDDVYTDNLHGLAVHVVRLNEVCGGGDDTGDDTGDAAADGGCGCSGAPGAPGAWVLLAGLGLIRRRRAS